MRWDYYQHRKNRDIEFLIAKTIAAFMNSAGGNLLIGVANDGVVLGLENDYKTLGNKQDADGFLLHLTQIVNFYLGKDMNAYCIPSIVGLAAKDICVVKVIPAPHPVFISKNNRDIFYIRAAASSEPLSRRQTRNYIRNHWK
jgi:predicted HTH transcriptional regulator